MGSAAKFHRHTWHIHHAHHIGVLLSEHRYSAGSLGLLDRHLLNNQIMRFRNPTVNQNLNLLEFLGRNSSRTVEVEAQAIEVHQRTCLADP
ncbi:MAG: Uncharacterised protein [Prochlorococcus marinus str. MIT 9313]|nr:MAG: Uncharacterised protein [Prochlorococcus marinus str. MIT 9313]